MSLGLTDEQRLFRAVAERFAHDAMPISNIRGRLGQPPSPEYLQRTGELGWYAAFVPTDLGGGSVSGRSVIDAAVLAEVQGAHLQPAPTVTAHLFARAVAMFGDQQTRSLLPAHCAGDAIGGFMFAETTRGWYARTAVTAEQAEDGFMLNGSVAIAIGVDTAGPFVVTASIDGAASAFVVMPGDPGVAITMLDSIDITRSMARVRFTDVIVPPERQLTCHRSDIEQLAALAAALSSAETVGTMRRLFDMTLEYAKVRVAFGRVIGSFQAIKHLLADLSLQVELSTAIVDEAVGALQDDRPDAVELASVTKAYVADSALDVSQGCLQIHGGIGYTWEHDLHLYLRRLAADAALFGSAQWHREHLWHLDQLPVGAHHG
ncbi:MAG: acyl-CoA dehydrogenase family protein [Acidimicrobiia bacterium]